MNRWVGLPRARSRVCRSPPPHRTPPPPRWRTLWFLLGSRRPSRCRWRRRSSRPAANSPTYRQTLNDAGPAKWGVRNAYGSLLPSVTVGPDMGYTGSGQSNFGGGFIRPTSAFLTSGYNLSLSGSSTAGRSPAPAQQKALQRATDEDISGAGVALRAEITTQYLTTLQATAQVAVARQQVTPERGLPDAGQGALPGGPGHPARRASGRGDQGAVGRRPAPRGPGRERGQARPAPAHGRGAAGAGRPDRADRLVPGAPRPPSSWISCSRWRTSRTRRCARSGPGSTPPSWGVRAAKSEFLPTLSVQAGWSGFTQEFTNENFLIDQTLGRRARRLGGGLPVQQRGAGPRSASAAVPDCFGRSGSTTTGTALLTRRAQQTPRRATTSSPSTTPASRSRPACRISLPIFTGFGRSLRLSQARAQEQDADEDVRARRLQVRSDVHARYLGLADLLPGDRGAGRPTARPRATSFAWRRTATGSAPAPRSRCPTRRTPCSGPKATT